MSYIYHQTENLNLLMQGQATCKKPSYLNKSSLTCTYPRDSPHYQVISIIPDKYQEVIPGTFWGDYCELYTPAFWKFMYHNDISNSNEYSHRLGTTVHEEVIACILGGYGIPAELGLAAFERMKKHELIQPKTKYEHIQKALAEPFELLDGSIRKYRFTTQKSEYIFQYLQRSDLNDIPTENHFAFREWLLSNPGIGLKTASWITRNWFNSEHVAILDIHVLRAGKIAGFFTNTENVSSKYLEMETIYIDFCQGLNVLPSQLDAIIWKFMKKTNRLALKVLSSIS
jgi:N-glycosylase/DNA lyase